MIVILKDNDSRYRHTLYEVDQDTALVIKPTNLNIYEQVGNNNEPYWIVTRMENGFQRANDTLYDSLEDASKEAVRIYNREGPKPIEERKQWKP